MIKRLFLNDRFILILILLNSVIIFLGGFEALKSDREVLPLIDNVITGLFIIELIVKFNEFGIRGYFKSNWRRLDFVLIALSLPTLFAFISGVEVINFSYLLVFRVMRVFKSFRFLKFIPGIEHLIKGVTRALKSSIFVLIGFAIYIFIIGIFSFNLFEETCPKYFSNPLNSLYSTFKIFTVEGWYEIPQQITEKLSPLTSFLAYVYFIFVVLTGGIFGLSIVNSIFVDAMVRDNNNELENKIELLDKKIDKLLNKEDS